MVNGAATLTHSQPAISCAPQTLAANARFGRQNFFLRGLSLPEAWAEAQTYLVGRKLTSGPCRAIFSYA